MGSFLLSKSVASKKGESFGDFITRGLRRSFPPSEDMEEEPASKADIASFLEEIITSAVLIFGGLFLVYWYVIR